MIDNIIANLFKKLVFLLIWFLIYIICGFEVAVIGILLFILTELREKR